MTLSELVAAGKSKGYTHIFNGRELYLLDDYETVGDADREYKLLDDGTVTHLENGMEWFSNCSLTTLKVEGNKLSFVIGDMGR